MSYPNKEFSKMYRQHLIMHTARWPEECRQDYKRAGEVLMATPEHLPPRLLQDICFSHDKSSLEHFAETMDVFLRLSESGAWGLEPNFSKFFENHPGSLPDFLQFSQKHGHEMLADYYENYYQSNYMEIRKTEEGDDFKIWRARYYGRKVKPPVSDLDLELMFYLIRFLPVHILYSRGTKALKELLEDEFGFVSYKYYIPNIHNYKDYLDLIKILNLDPEGMPDSSNPLKKELWMLLCFKFNVIKQVMASKWY
ncbi:MAG: hypothetical protein ACQES9_12930 [Myxococcota bacterium]